MLCNSGFSASSDSSKSVSKRSWGWNVRALEIAPVSLRSNIGFPMLAADRVGCGGVVCGSMDGRVAGLLICAMSDIRRGCRAAIHRMPLKPCSIVQAASKLIRRRCTNSWRLGSPNVDRQTPSATCVEQIVSVYPLAWQHWGTRGGLIAKLEFENSSD